MPRINKKINGLGYIGQHREITAALPNQIPNLRVAGSNPAGVTIFSKGFVAWSVRWANTPANGTARTGPKARRA